MVDFQSPVLSPNGRQLAFIDVGVGRRQIFIRRLDSIESQPLAGTHGVDYVAWSPDSNRIAFLVDAKLKRIDLRTGVVQYIADAADCGRHFCWSSARIFLFSALSNGPPSEVSLSDVQVSYIKDSFKSLCAFPLMIFLRSVSVRSSCWSASYVAPIGAKGASVANTI